jgi:hypothetical protein
MQAAPAVHDSMKLRLSMMEPVEHVALACQTGFLPKNKVAILPRAPMRPFMAGCGGGVKAHTAARACLTSTGGGIRPRWLARQQKIRFYAQTETTMSISLILLILLILLLVGALPTWGHSRSWGYGPSGGLGLVVLILVVLLLMGKI